MTGGGQKQAANQKHVSPLCFRGLELGVRASLVNACGQLHLQCMRAKSFLRQLYLPSFPLSPVLVFQLWFRPLLSLAVRLSSPHLIFPPHVSSFLC